MHKFGVWYFEVGWIIATAVGVIAGPFIAIRRNSSRNLALWCIAISVVGLTALYAKHYLK